MSLSPHSISYFDLQKKYFTYTNKEMPAPVGFNSSARMPGVYDAIKQLQSNTGHTYLVGGAVRTLHHMNQEKDHMNHKEDEEGKSGFGNFLVTDPHESTWHHTYQKMNDDGKCQGSIILDVLCVLASILVIVLLFGVFSFSF